VPQLEISAIRTLFTSKPRPVVWTERRRQRLDEVGSVWPVAADVQLEPVDLDGVPGEWSIVPGGDASRVLMFFQAVGYCSGRYSAITAGDGGGPRRQRAHARRRLSGWRRSTRFRRHSNIRSGAARLRRGVSTVTLSVRISTRSGIDGRWSRHMKAKA
jgi:hypothetical protein